MAAYSGAHGLNAHTLKNWAYRLSKEEKAVSGFARVLRRRSKGPTSREVSSEALRVHCGGALVEVPSSFDAKAFGQVMAVLRSAGREGGTR